MKFFEAYPKSTRDFDHINHLAMDFVIRHGTGLLKGFRVLGEDKVKVNTCEMFKAGLEGKTLQKR